MATGTHITYHKDNQRGTWYFRLKYADGKTGQRAEKKRSGFASKRDAVKAGQEVIADVVGGVLPSRGQRTFADGYERFRLHMQDRLDNGSLKPATLDGYEQHYRLYLEPYWAARQMDDISGDDVRALFRELRTNVGHGCQGIAWYIGRKVYELAVVASEVRVSPFSKCGKRSDVIGAPKRRIERDQWWTPDEVAEFLTVLADNPHHFGDLWRVQLGAGLRRGEALGARDSVIDWDARTMVIDRQWTHNSQGKAYWSTPKTAAGNRTVPLNALALDALRSARTTRNEARMAQRHIWDDELGVLFARPLRENRHNAPGVGAQVAGTLPHPNHVTTNFREYLARHGLRPIKLHGLRHTFAAGAVNSGTPLEVVSKILGHASIEITADLYYHATPEVMLAAVDQLDAYWTGENR